MATKQILDLAYFPLIGKRTRDANFFDTAQALEDRRAVGKESARGSDGSPRPRKRRTRCSPVHFILLLLLLLYSLDTTDTLFYIDNVHLHVQLLFTVKQILYLSYFS